jgi:hypothetical protein
MVQEDSCHFTKMRFNKIQPGTMGRSVDIQQSARSASQRFREGMREKERAVKSSLFLDGDKECSQG